MELYDNPCILGLERQLPRSGALLLDRNEGRDLMGH